MLELTDDKLSQIISENEKVIVQYGATWCGNCRVIKPKFKRLSAETEGVKFVYVDAEEYPNSRKLAEVTNLPTFAGFRNGELISQNAGNKIETVTTILNEITNN